MQVNIVNCTKPIVIVNRKFLYYAQKSGKIVYNGQIQQWTTQFNRQTWQIPPHIYMLTNTLDPTDVETINRYYIPMPDGRKEPIYQVVKCGKCSNCRKTRATEYVHRCIMEQQQYNSLPLFITLTYNQDSYTGEVNKRHCQLFLKRLRKELLRNGYDDKFRYILVSEYGKHTQRAHYHMIMFQNLPYEDIIKTDIIESAWQQGHVDIKQCDKGAYGYTLKYMRKKGKQPKGKADTFMLSSRKNGGIGSKYLTEEIRPYVLANLNVQIIEYLDKETGKVNTLPMAGYILNKVLPSPSQIVRQELRDALKYTWSMMSGDDYVHTATEEAVKKLEMFHGKLYKSETYMQKLFQLKTFSDCETYLDMRNKTSKIFRKYDVYNYDFDYVCKCKQQRQSFLESRQYQPLTIEQVNSTAYNLRNEDNQYNETF